MTTKVLVTSHKHLIKIDDELVKYLIKKSCKDHDHYIVEHVYHSFSDAKDRKSFRKRYQKNKLFLKQETFDLHFLPNFLIYLKEFLFLFRILVFGKKEKKEKKVNLYIALDGLLSFYGLFFKKIGLVNKVVFWCIDYVPNNRFDSIIENLIYRKINRFSICHSDEIWDLSPRMAEAREKFEGIKSSQYKKRKLVPQGVWPDKQFFFRFSDLKKKEIVYLGVLIKKYGIHLIIESLTYIKDVIPSVTFKIIGDGHYQDELKALSRKLKVEQHCVFVGRVDKYEEIMKHLSKASVGVAPYVKKLDTWTYYADPGKIKSYLIAGLPILLTDLPWNAPEIEKRKCGKIISENPKEIAQDILFYLTDANLNQTARENAFAYGKEFDYNHIFKSMAKI